MQGNTINGASQKQIFFFLLYFKFLIFGLVPDSRQQKIRVFILRFF